MREIPVSTISDAVAELCRIANFELPQDFVTALRVAQTKEASPRGLRTLQLLDQNQEVARAEQVPSCQDTGFVIVFADVGTEVKIIGGELEEAIQAGVGKGYKQNYLRASMVEDPLFNRTNTGNNTPAMTHYEFEPGDQVHLKLIVKGGGSENSTKLYMLTPAQGAEGVKKAVVEAVRMAGPNACPPLVVCVGVGGTADKAMLIAKKASLREVGSPHPDERIAQFERELLEEVNATGVGPQGYGGRVTALAVHVETFPTHIASLPVAVNLQCHAVRRASVTI
ncbi:MAG: fumarate hydratase [Chloroflexi bacterium]|uniref:Fumarate hydratase n=1 Tax=Candidatus Chlorohelix allophototropha TaxID=3003348 RepID=A0A8T7M789_9CHLR|nr:fumarate hydratase [Chloroflexota bacterium]WJW69790.1 fumarate hydratase [Chloroflexota bacterium L227-S17]